MNVRIIYDQRIGTALFIVKYWKPEYQEHAKKNGWRLVYDAEQERHSIDTAIPEWSQQQARQYALQCAHHGDKIAAMAVIIDYLNFIDSFDEQA